MFIRFTVPSDVCRPEPRTAAGLFHATYRLAEQGRFEEGERLWFAEEMCWFNEFLRGARVGAHRRAVCWFRGDAGEAISRMWRIVDLVEGHGVPVRVYRTTRPGIVVYSDDLQIAAVPWRDTFCRRESRRSHGPSARPSRALPAALARGARNEARQPRM